MRRLTRPSPPAHLDTTLEGAVGRIVAWYDAPQPRDHWNDPEGDERPVREALRAMSGDRCAWCGAALGALLEVEHYLPQSVFPWLRYCWLNLLPACGPCNGAKRNWSPPALAGRTLVDPCLQGLRAGEPYRPAALLPSVDDRLLEPTLDDPADHLAFSPADCTWRAKSGVGRRTIAKLFSDRSYNLRMQRLSALAHEFVRHAATSELVEVYLDLHGHEAVFCALLDHWRAFYPPRLGAP